MVLGCSYNVFDGLELLPGSISSIRSAVDFVCAVYTDDSNFGSKSFIDISEFLIGKVDEKIRYIPKSLGGHNNEIAKRNMGIDACAAAGCTHFMLMDVDEYFKADRLMTIKKIIEDNSLDSTACMMQTYYKLPTMSLAPPEDYYVPLIYKLDGRRLVMSEKWPVLADPTRKMKPGKFRAFTRDEIEMHHMSYVRNDIRLKLNNSSAVNNYRSNIESIAKHHDTWTHGQDAVLAGKELRYYKLKETPNHFNIDIR